MYSVLLSKIEFVFPLIKDRLEKIVNENMKVIVMPWAFPTELDYDRLVNEYFKEVSLLSLHNKQATSTVPLRLIPGIIVII